MAMITVVCCVVVPQDNVDLFPAFVVHKQISQGGAVRDELTREM